jgi:hypothetical protein
MSEVVGGTCFGFQVRSPLPFTFLRGGDGDPLEVVLGDESVGEDPGDLLFEWTPSAHQPLQARLYGGGAQYSFWLADGGWFTIDLDVPRITVPRLGDPIRREERLWTLPALLCFSRRGDLPLHAAAVEVDGAAILLAGPRTWGKTTLAAAFMEAGHRVLTEDVACVRLLPDAAIVPGPAMLRVRHDVAARLPITAAECVGMDEDRVHLAVDRACRGNCAPVPLRAIVILRDGKDLTRLERIAAAKAIPDLWALGFRLPGPHSVGGSFADLADLVRSVPVWNLFRPFRLERLAEVVPVVAAVV